MNTQHTLSNPSTTVERRKFPREVALNGYVARASAEREFGIGYGRSSGYAHVRSYIGTQPALFRCS